MAQFTQKQILNYQKRAQLDFVPFIADYFSGKRVMHKNHLPLGHPDVLTAHAVDILAKMLPKAIWLQLGRYFGWRRLDYLYKQQRYNGRLWQSFAKHAQVLSFSDYSIELLLCLYNDSSLEKNNIKLCEGFSASRKTNGDLVLQFLIFINWLESNRLTAEKKKLFNDNFLCCLMLTEDSEEERLNCGRSFNAKDFADAGILLPWLNAFWAQRWLDAEPNRWQTQAAFIKYSTQQNTVLRAWFGYLLQQRAYDLFNGFMLFYNKWHAMGLVNLENQFETMCRDMRLSERHNRVLLLQPHFDLIIELNKLYQEFVGLHPVEREDDVVQFLSDYGKNDFAEVSRDWLDLRNRLLPAIQ